MYVCVYIYIYIYTVYIYIYIYMYSISPSVPAALGGLAPNASLRHRRSLSCTLVQWPHCSRKSWCGRRGLIGCSL